jgi:hypothetical protein
MLVTAEAMLRRRERPMSTSRKARILRERASPVSEMASELRQGLELVARALCVQAVERHAKNPGHHREFAAVMWIDVVSDFHEVKVTPETRNWFASLLKIDPKSLPKGP